MFLFIISTLDVKSCAGNCYFYLKMGYFIQRYARRNTVEKITTLSTGVKDKDIKICQAKENGIVSPIFQKE